MKNEKKKIFFFSCSSCFRGGSVRADILIKTVNTDQYTVDKLLSDELQKAQLGSLKVDRYEHSIEVLKSQALCAAEFLNVTWSDMMVGDTDYQKCPRNAEGMSVCPSVCVCLSLSFLHFFHSS